MITTGRSRSVTNTWGDYKMTKHLIHYSKDLPIDHWLTRLVPPEMSLRAYAEDRAVAELTGTVLETIERAGLTRAEVARLLGTTKSYVSQVLNGSTNMTLKTLGALLWAAGREVGELRTAQMGAPAQPRVAAIFAFQSATAPQQPSVDLTRLTFVPRAQYPARAI